MQNPHKKNPAVVDPAATGNPYTSRAKAYYALVILTIVYSFNFIDRQLLAILQESVKADLGLTDSQLGLLTGFAFAVFYATLGVPLAVLSDRMNRRNIVAGAVTVWSIMTAACGLARASAAAVRAILVASANSLTSTS